MAQISTVRLVDDLTGGQADETVTFALDGRTFEIDLSESNAARLREQLKSFVAAGRRSGATSDQGGRSRKAPRQKTAAGSGDRQRNQTIRRWARDNGYVVSNRGRLSSEIIDAYCATTETTRPATPQVQFSG